MLEISLCKQKTESMSDQSATESKWPCQKQPEIPVFMQNTQILFKST